MGPRTSREAVGSAEGLWVILLTVLREKEECLLLHSVRCLRHWCLGLGSARWCLSFSVHTSHSPLWIFTLFMKDSRVQKGRVKVRGPFVGTCSRCATDRESLKFSIIRLFLYKCVCVCICKYFTPYNRSVFWSHSIISEETSARILCLGLGRNSESKGRYSA